MNTTSRTRKTARICAISIAAFLASHSTQAATGTWTGASSTAWDTTATNWSGVSGTPWDSTNGVGNFSSFNSAGINSGAASITSQVFSSLVTFSDQTGLNSGAISGTSLVSGFTLTVSGSGQMRPGTVANTGVDIDNSGAIANTGNTITLTAPGTLAAPTWETRSGASSNALYVGMFSSYNTFNVQNGAFLFGNGSGTAAWHIGGTAAANNNSLVVDGTNSAISRSTSNSVNVGEAGSNNFYVAQNGGTIVGGRVAVGTNGGANNYQLTTGTNSYFRLNGGTGTFFDVGVISGSNGNSFRVGTGGRADVFGTGTTRRTGVGEVVGADSNYVQISGAGAQFNYLHNLPMVIGGNISNSATTITTGGNLNRMDVLSGGTLYMDNTGGTLAAPPSNPSFTYAANPTLSAALVLTGTNTTFNLGDGNSIATAVIGKNTNFSGVVLGIASQGDTNSKLKINNGRLTAGTGLGNGNLISGTG